MDFSFARYHAIQARMQAFNTRDLQTAGVILTWGKRCGIAPEELLLFLQFVPFMMELNRIGYFAPEHSPEQLAVIKKFERNLPRDVRRELRKTRLEMSHSGAVHG